MQLLDDDVPMLAPDPVLDDWASAQAKRALHQLLQEQQEPVNQPLPVVIH